MSANLGVNTARTLYTNIISLCSYLRTVTDLLVSAKTVVIAGDGRNVKQMASTILRFSIGYLFSFMLTTKLAAKTKN